MRFGSSGVPCRRGLGRFVYTLRLTRALLDRFDPAQPGDDPEDVTPTTRLGDWYVMPVAVCRRHLLLCTSERSLLSVVLPADDLAELPERLVTALVGVLHRLGAPQAAIVAEVDAMTSGGVGAARNRSTLGAMRGLAARTRTWLAGTRGDVDVAALYADLATYRSRVLDGHPASERAVQLLVAAQPHPRRAAARPRARR
jgi:hypothetical protein